jgi:hypothetical protein
LARAPLLTGQAPSFLGNLWNRMPPTQLYDDLGEQFEPPI